jgi:hypothetical protein
LQSALSLNSLGAEMTITHQREGRLPRRFLPLLSLAAFFFGVSVPVLRADDNCQKRITRADHKLHEAAQKHGWNSPEVEKWRQELAEARSWCWEHGHRWWDEGDNDRN